MWWPGSFPPEFYEDDHLVDLLSRDADEATRLVREHFEEFSADLETSVRKMGSGSGPDAAIYRASQVQAWFLRGRREAFRQGIDGAVTELLLANQPWGFSLRDLRSPLSWWHGDLDPMTPLPAVRRALMDAPQSRLTVYPGEGHGIGLVHGEEIVSTLARHR